jgi:hypothetical protein
MTSYLQILNIGDVSTWMNHEMLEDEDGFVTKSILCMPIVNGQKTVIGVAQLINKVRDPHRADTFGSSQDKEQLFPCRALTDWVL